MCVLSNTVAIIYKWLLSICNVASRIEEPNYLFILIHLHLDLNSHMWLVASILDSTTLSDW